MEYRIVRFIVSFENNRVPNYLRFNQVDIRYGFWNIMKSKIEVAPHEIPKRKEAI